MKKAIKVLSLFDGMSCGQIALNRAGIKYDQYFASEIEKPSIKVTQDNYPATIQLGDVRNVKGSDLPRIDLLLGGSPCQGFSNAGKGLNFEDPRSVLFFEYVRILKETGPAFFLLENVPMLKEHEVIISQYLGVEPIFINSALVSAQNRERIYWTNINLKQYGLFGEMIADIPQPKDKGILLADILDEPFDEKLLLSAAAKTRVITKKRSRVYNTTDKKCGCILHNQSKKGTDSIVIYGGGQIYRWPSRVECERMQTVPDNYTKAASSNDAIGMCGNGWTVDVIAYIFSFANFA